MVAIVAVVAVVAIVAVVSVVTVIAGVLFITLPWVEPPKIHIEQDKIQAKTSHERFLQTLVIESAGYYTDGSGINQKVGAAAVQLVQGFSNISVFLGSIIYYTVYAAELSGILVAIHMALAIPLTSKVRRVRYSRITNLPFGPFISQENLLDSRKIVESEQCKCGHC